MGGLAFLLSISLAGCGNGSFATGKTIGIMGRQSIANPDLGIDHNFKGKCASKWVALLDGQPNGQAYSVSITLKEEFSRPDSLAAAFGKNNKCLPEISEIENLAKAKFGNVPISYWLISTKGVRLSP